MPITVGVGNIIYEEGYSLLVSLAADESVWKDLLCPGAISMGSNAWVTVRILHGRPAPGKELTHEFKGAITAKKPFLRLEPTTASGRGYGECMFHRRWNLVALSQSSKEKRFPKK